VQVTVVGISLACERAGMVFTVHAGCPAGHRLNFLYPIVLPPDLWLSGPTDSATRTVIYSLPVELFSVLDVQLLVRLSIIPLSQFVPCYITFRRITLCIFSLDLI